MNINDNNINNTCPGCGRHCDLSAPHCPTGREYAETGKLPENGGHHHHHHEHQDNANMNPNEKLLHSLRMVSRTLNHSAEPTGGQDRVLAILAEKGTVGQKELMDTLAVKAGSLSELLGKLENAGLISRTRNEEDHRAVDVTLTEQGRKRAEATAAQKGNGRNDMFSALTEEEVTQLTEILDKLANDWRQRFGGHERGQRHERPHEHEQGHEHHHRHGHGHEHGHHHEQHNEHGHHGRREH